MPGYGFSDRFAVAQTSRLRLALCCLTASAFALSGCSVSKFPEPSANSSSLPQITGKVHGGQQPVSGGTIQLYAASTTALKGASTALLSTTVVTDANGYFTITGDYTCPSADALVYIASTGGNPGLPGAVNNSEIALMSVLGTCGTLTSATFISMNELTTVTSVESLAQFMTDIAHIGSDPSNVAGLTGAFSGAQELVDFATGLPRSAAAGVVFPTAQLDTLADILAACVNTSGGTAGDGSGCGKLLLYTANGTTTDTVLAMLHIAQSPAKNVASLFALVTAQSPFQPTLSTAPLDWTIPIGYPLPPVAGADGRHLIAVDTAQHVWVYTSAETISPTGVITPTGVVTIYDNSGTVLHTIASGTGGLAAVGQLAADPFGNMWAVNGDLTLSKFDPNGAPLTTSTGISVPYLPPTQFGVGTSEYPLGISYMSIDPSGNVWGIGSGTSSNCYIEANKNGTILTNTGDFCSQAVNQYTIATATDGSGNAWFLGTNALARTDSKGNFLNFGTNTNGCLAFNYAGATTNPTAVYDWTLNLAYDRKQHQLWGASYLGIGAVHDDGTPVFCDPQGGDLPTAAINETAVDNGTTTTSTATYNFVGSIAVDGAGNLWFTTGGLNLTVTTPDDHSGETFSVAATGGLNELDPSGKLLTPKNVNGLSGYQTTFGAVGENLAVDSYGNIWLINSSNQLAKISGLATPKTYQ